MVPRYTPYGAHLGVLAGELIQARCLFKVVILVLKKHLETPILQRLFKTGALSRVLVGEQEREEEKQRAAEGVVDEMIREVTDQLIKQTVEEAKLEVCMEEGLPPEIPQMIDDYAV